MNAPITSSVTTEDSTLPRPAGAAPGVVAVAWPTGRVIHPYTPEELTRGVDLYTRALQGRTDSPVPGGSREA